MQRRGWHSNYSAVEAGDAVLIHLLAQSTDTMRGLSTPIQGGVCDRLQLTSNYRWMSRRGPVLGRTRTQSDLRCFSGGQTPSHSIMPAIQEVVPKGKKVKFDRTPIMILFIVWAIRVRLFDQAHEEWNEGQCVHSLRYDQNGSILRCRHTCASVV